MDTFPFIILSHNSFNVVDDESSGPLRASLSFEQQNTQLPSEMSPFPYFKTTSEFFLW